MAGENCVANSPIDHQYWISDYADADTDPYVQRFTTDNFGLQRTVDTVMDEGTGSAWDVEGSEQDAKYPVRGPLTLTPRPDQMGTFLSCLFGNAPLTATTYGPAGKICDFFHIGHYDPTHVKVFQYKNLVCNTWNISASDSQALMKLEMNVEGASAVKTDYTIGAFPAMPLSTGKPWLLRQAVVTLDGTAQRVKDVRISGNNNLSTDDFYNSAFRVEIPSLRQQFEFTHTNPFDKTQDLGFLDQVANIVGQVVFTSGTNVLTIDFPSLFARPTEPTISGRQRVHNTITWKAQYDPNESGEIPIKATLVTA